MKAIHLLCLAIVLAPVLAFPATCGGGSKHRVLPGPVNDAPQAQMGERLVVGSHEFYWTTEIGHLCLVEEAGSQITVVVGDVRLVDGPPDSGRPYHATVMRNDDRTVLMEYFADVPSAKAWVEAQVREWYSGH